MLCLPVTGILVAAGCRTGTPPGPRPQPRGCQLAARDHGETPAASFQSIDGPGSPSWSELKSNYIDCLEFTGKGERGHRLVPMRRHCALDPLRGGCWPNGGSIYPEKGARFVSCQDLKEHGGRIVARVYVDYDYFGALRAGTNWLWVEWVEGTCGRDAKYRQVVVSPGNEPGDRRVNPVAQFTHHTYDDTGIHPPFKGARDCDKDHRVACFVDDSATVTEYTEASRATSQRPMFRLVGFRNGDTEGLMPAASRSRFHAMATAAASQTWVKLNGMCSCSGDGCH